MTPAGGVVELLRVNLPAERGEATGTAAVMLVRTVVRRIEIGIGTGGAVGRSRRGSRLGLMGGGILVRRRGGVEHRMAEVGKDVRKEGRMLS